MTNNNGNAEKLERRAGSSIALLAKPNDESLGVVVTDAILEEVRNGLVGLMDNYAVACIEEGLPLDDWRQKVNAVLEIDQGLAGQIYGDFCNYSDKADTDPSSAVTLERVKLKLDSALEIMARPEAERQAILANLGTDDQSFKDAIIDQAEMLSFYAQDAGSFTTEWPVIIAKLAALDPITAYEVTRLSINPQSLTSPKTSGDMEFACRLAYDVAKFQGQQGNLAEGTSLFRQLHQRAAEGVLFLGPDTLLQMEGLNMRLTQSWQRAVNTISDPEKRAEAQAALDDFKKNEISRKEQSLDDKPSSDNQPPPPTPGGP